MAGDRKKSGSALRSPKARGRAAQRRAGLTSKTDQQRITQAKREWETTVDALPQFVCLLDSAGRILRANRVVESWTIDSVDTVKGKTLHDLFCPDCANPDCHLMQMWSRMHEGLLSGTADFWVSDELLSGRALRIQLRPIFARGRALRDARTSSAILVIEDITELKRAEAIQRNAKCLLEQQVRERTAALEDSNTRLRREIEERRAVEAALTKSEERYRGLIDTMVEGLIVTDPAGHIVYVNDSFCAMLGRARAELIGQDVGMCSRDGHSCGMMQAVVAEQSCPPTRFVCECLHKDGRPITVHVSQQRLLDQQGRYDGCFAVVMDVTERHRAEDALRRSENELRLLSAQLLAAQEVERKRIASELHDGISQTLSAVKFYLENSAALCRSGETPAGPEAIERIVPKVQAAIDEVRRISMALRPSTLDDLGILATLAWFCREFQAIYGQPTLDLAVQARESDIAAPLKTMIYRIVQEALNNVVKHAQATRARVQLGCTDESIELSVSDNGIGFDPEQLVLREGQYGIGLSSMRERAEGEGGLFRCLSTPRGGTTISVSWPRPGSMGRLQ
jgi:PAS domain S-box-containing protein